MSKPTNKIELNVIRGYYTNKIRGVLSVFEKRRVSRGRRIQSREIIETMLMSEEVLARDWNAPEENEAWKNL